MFAASRRKERHIAGGRTVTVNLEMGRKKTAVSPSLFPADSPSPQSAPGNFILAASRLMAPHTAGALRGWLGTARARRLAAARLFVCPAYRSRWSASPTDKNAQSLPRRGDD